MAMPAAPTLNIGLNRQHSRAVLVSRTMLHRTDFTSSVRTTKHEKSVWFLIHKKPTVHRGPPCCMSIDVGKEENSNVDLKSEGNGSVVDVGTKGTEEEEASSLRLDLEEKFAVLNTGKYECTSCGYIYDQALGDPSYPIAPGLEFSRLPEDWRCATCGAAKSYFNSKSIEVAGFVQNQKFGLGGNTLTSGQKSILIYGSLLFGFVLFLMGYFLQ
uniref:TSA: Wollemia nobilis Ref_Wollemi_Transcript_5132_874 transcribed RNA sequence n=1 Tax=Wollemia nobilis TaxID=56998 RepID=A0A0C9S8B6_9CONI